MGHANTSHDGHRPADRSADIFSPEPAPDNPYDVGYNDGYEKGYADALADINSNKQPDCDRNLDEFPFDPDADSDINPAPECRCPITCFNTTINRYHDNRYCGCAAHADAPELARPGVRSASDGDAHICAYRIGNPDCIADDHPAADPKPDCLAHGDADSLAAETHPDCNGSDCIAVLDANSTTIRHGDSCPARVD